jgi:hypothetical protein
LSKVLRDELGVEVGNTLTVAGQLLTVGQMTLADLKSGKTMMLHPKFESLVGDTLNIEKNG